MLTNFYIDGFNLYYGALKGTPYKWLDFTKLFNLYFPSCRINQIRYFTARVQSSQRNPGKQRRQRLYIRALKTIPNLSVHYGYFLTNPARMPLVNPSADGPNAVEVMRTEEKGTDVNLASQLLLDGFKRNYRLAIIVSNDSDFVEPIKIVRNELGLRVGVLNPHRNPSRALMNAADFYRQIRQGPISASQFPDTLADAVGAFHKPPQWSSGV